MKDMERGLLLGKETASKAVARNVAILSGDRVVTAYCKAAEDLELEQVLSSELS